MNQKQFELLCQLYVAQSHILLRMLSKKLTGKRKLKMLLEHNQHTMEELMRMSNATS